MGRKLNARGSIGACDGPFALVEHLHVAAERNRREPVFDVVRPRAAPLHDGLAEAYREPQHLEAEPARNPVMAKLVDGHEHTDRNDETQDR